VSTLVDKVTGPLGPRRHIAANLRQLREASGKILTDVAGDLLISTSKLSRLENAQGKPQLRDIRDLIRYYGIEGEPLAARLERWVAAAKRPGWWTDYGDQMGGGLDAHLAYEADATVERAYTIPFIPALLQTTNYAETIFRDMAHLPETDIGQSLEVRHLRQEVLRSREGLDPLKLVAVTHESTLRQPVGSPQIMHDQLNALIGWSGEPNVSLHVLPFAAGPVFTMTCMYAYFEYADDLEPDVVHIETHAGFWSIDDPKRVAEYRRAHDSLVSASLSEADSIVLIESVRDDL
jgi:hypothetical protein